MEYSAIVLRPPPIDEELSNDVENHTKKDYRQDIVASLYGMLDAAPTD